MGLTTLWAAAECAPWHVALESYLPQVEAVGGAKLVDLDRWYHAAWPAQVRARAQPAITRDELLSVIRWKMHRGVWRERNLRLAEANPEDEVRERTARALAAVPDPRRPLDEIAALRGVGAATASAVLAALEPAHYPFLDELVAVQVADLPPPAFTVRYYLAYADALRARRAKLAETCSHRQWTIHDVDLALWAAAAARGEPRQH